MKILPTRAASVSRQGLCTALLVASLTAAVGVSPAHNTADSDDPAKDPKNPQGLPHGTPNLTLPDLRPKGPGGLPGARGDGKNDAKDATTGIPATALDAYRKAAQRAAADLPGCHMPWELIAGIGNVETHHGTYQGTRMTSDGTTDKPILGPQLNGNGFALIKDTDRGALDGDTAYDKAVGPTQFLPSTWALYGADGNGDGKKDPNNIYDAALGTAKYLCAGGKDMNSAADLDKAILSYNPSREYVNAVTSWMRAYKEGNVPSLPDRPGKPSGNTPAGSGTPAVPPVPSAPQTPGTSPKPSKPAPPANGGNNKPGGGSKPGGGTDKPGDSGTHKPGGGGTDKPGGGGKPGGDTGKPVPPAPASRLERIGDDRAWETYAGETFKEQARVLVKDKSGKPVADARVRFEVGGEAGGAFADGSTTITVPTAKDGTATAPRVVAGLKSGKVTLTAKVVGRDIPAVEFAGTVKVRAAKQIVVVDSSKLKAEPNSAFPDRIQFKVLGEGGKDVIGAEVTVSVTKTDKETVPEEGGPYFKGTDGKPVRIVKAGTTDKDGVLTLPKLLTDDKAGAYMLRLETADGKVETVHLTVVAAQTTMPPTTPTPPAPPKPAA
ncbi:lytic murein transglycosylase [Streptomyces roseifaciens]|uniref:lytic transglycosylase domain-containing protein n=1 Tax=Streptomyces roseifaciens TaxID=1488406 RepID=UPI0007181583|nr:lytic murein transglycosylase [Streptomyces roseifaciens]